MSFGNSICPGLCHLEHGVDFGEINNDKLICSSPCSTLLYCTQSWSGMAGRVWGRGGCRVGWLEDGGWGGGGAQGELKQLLSSDQVLVARTGRYRSGIENNDTSCQPPLRRERLV